MTLNTIPKPFLRPLPSLSSINSTRVTPVSFEPDAPWWPYTWSLTLRGPPWLFQSLICVWRLSPGFTLGFHKSHPCVVESHSVFYSWAEPDPLTCMQNPSLFTTPWQTLSDLVILHCVICAVLDKAAVNSGEPCCHRQVYFYMWKIRQLAHSTVD